ncbi:uncharacterized protein F5891DRAFT_1191864 [Suillus fuscotomentosus]|uniref:Uncharacterized protein n=1 Tax=Suillus fuscotomentosus TaxID=1912939 RepID=A0AAD4E153_9AGAM|nr:uncharacterized protein F5891DRAFT_1191864 [Suillus fuscotomentosus]KAG1897422.1 hypothetical protein F5891DRAFT_1191864 [Suillus fuscotomentosus]
MRTAKVEQSAPSKPPRLLAGELTPEVVCDWDNTCTTYFMHKDIEAADQVKMIAFGMLDARLHTWYLAQRAILDAGTFNEYMTALKSAWLEKHWDIKLRRKVLGSQQGNHPFYEWVLELQNQNALLYGGTSHLDNDQLWNQLEANICNELTIPVLRANLADDLTLREWIEEIKHLDDKRLDDLAAHKKIAEELFKSSKRNISSNNRPSSSKTYTSSTCLGSLTEVEQILLSKHRGCFKCRKFYVSHQSKDCPNGAPEATNYKSLMEADALTAKPKTRTVAAVTPVNAVMPTSTIEEVSDSDDDLCIAPLETAHLIWPCLLTGPSINYFEHVDALIDHRSHLVLIDENIVTKLGMRRRKLHTKIEAKSAFTDSVSLPFSFSEYVLLSPSSLNNDWTSHTIHAIVALGLSVPLLLGGPFLQHNYLVIDHETRTCISKNSQYDLLNAPQRIQRVTKAHPSRRDVLHMRKNVIRELKGALGPQYHKVKQHATSKSNDITSVLCRRIDTLAFIEDNKEHLERLDKEMRRKYDDRFPEDIPHIDELPTDIVH